MNRASFYPLRWISRPGLLGLVFTLAVGVLGYKHLVPPRPEFPENDELTRLALQALNDGGYQRAHEWLKAAREQAAAEKGEEPGLPSAPEMAAGYLSGAARDTVLGAPGTDEFVREVTLALLQLPAEFKLHSALLEAVGPVAANAKPNPEMPREFVRSVRRALMHLVMLPTLAQIARTACGLPRELPLHADTEELPPAELDQRLLRWFEFVRDSVATMPEPVDDWRRPLQYPLDTLYQGTGRVPEVNWLFAEGAEMLGNVWAFELVLAPSSLRPRRSRWSDDPNSLLHDMELPLQTRPSNVAAADGGPGRIVIVLVPRGAKTRILAFDLHSGAPWLNEAGQLINLLDMDWNAPDQRPARFDATSRLHPVLVESLPYGAELERVNRGQVGLLANPLRSTMVAYGMQALGMDARPRPGPSAFALLRGMPLARQGPWEPSPWCQPPEDTPDVSTVARSQIEAAAPIVPASLANAFPFRWRFEFQSWPLQVALEQRLEEQVALQNWPLIELRSEMLLGTPPTTWATGLQRKAMDENRTYRQRALDYQRPNDAQASFEHSINERMDWEMVTRTAWPISTDSGQVGPPEPTRKSPRTVATAGWVIWDGGRGVRVMPGQFRIKTKGADTSELASVNLWNRGPQPIRLLKVTFENPDTRTADTDAFEVLDMPAEPLLISTALSLTVRFTPRHAGTSRTLMCVTLGTGEPGAKPVGPLRIPLMGEAPIGDVVLGLPQAPAAFGSPFTALPLVARRVLPVVYDGRAMEVRGVQNRFSAAWCAYLTGRWQASVMHASDYLKALERVLGGGARTEYPGVWRFNAWWLQGRALWAQGRTEQALAAWEKIPAWAPLAAGARLAAKGVLAMPTPYIKE